MITLTYSSITKGSKYGFGWDAKFFSSITRSTRHGVPTYDDADEFEIDGDILSKAAFTSHYYRRRHDFSRIKRHHAPSGSCSSSDWWEVTSPDGVVRRYGCRSEAKSQIRFPRYVAPPEITAYAEPSNYPWFSQQYLQHEGATYAWHLDEIEDTSGNRILVDYETDAAEADTYEFSQEIYPSRVHYNLRPGESGEGARVVRFHWKPRYNTATEGP